jgi:hypothetical protein
MVSGTKRVRVIEAYAPGNDVHKITKMKINQTWLASQTGPMECSMTPRGRSLRSACGEVPKARSEVGAPEDRVRDDGQQQHYGDRRAHPITSSAPAGTSGWLGPYGVS